MESKGNSGKVWLQPAIRRRMRPDCTDVSLRNAPIRAFDQSVARLPEACLRGA